MGKVKVRHAVIQYEKKEGDRTLVEMAFRNQVVDLPSGEEKRLREAGAVIDADQMPERPGTLLTLPESPSDEELIAWVLAATPLEIERVAQERPLLAHRFESARLHIRNQDEERQNAITEAARATSRIRDENPLVANQGEEDGADEASDPDTSAGGVRGTGGPESAEGTGVNNEIGGPAGVTPPLVNPNDPTAATALTQAGLVEGQSEEEKALGAKAPDEVVKGNAESVARYLADYPMAAQSILEAENRRAEADPSKPVRSTVVRAAEAAVQFTTGRQ